MIVKLATYLVFALLCINAPANAAIPPADKLIAAADRDIVRISDTKYVGKKKIPYRDIDGSTKEDDVFFVFEKLTTSNRPFWRGYIDEQKANAQKDYVYLTGIKLMDGVSSFALSLNLDGPFQRFGGRFTSDVWVAYATRQDPREFSATSENIEMVFSVFVNATSPITTHMGIARNYRYFSFAYMPHFGLSIDLHAFASAASNLIYGQKSLMMTRPASKMLEILVKGFEKKGLQDFIWVGDTLERINKADSVMEQRRKMKENEDKVIQDLAVLDRFKDNPAAISLDDFRSFTTRYLMRSPGDTESGALYEEIKKKVEFSADSCRIDRKLDEWHPNDLSILPPLDNRDPTNWKITLDGRTIEFTRPDWFGRALETRGAYGRVNADGGHEHLVGGVTSHLLTVMIDSRALSSLW